jgi:hypothetical protein
MEQESLFVRDGLAPVSKELSFNYALSQPTLNTHSVS